MERRRFVPAPEGLERRAVLSTLFGHSSSTVNKALNNPQLDIPFTFRQKDARIAHLPFYMNQLQQGRFLPKATVESIQEDLTAVEANLHPVPPKVLDDFNHFLRNVLPKASISTGDAHGLTRGFGSVLNHAGATPGEVASFQSDINALAKVDANSPNPVYLATNDYSLVLQAALSVGHTIKTPTAPLLKLKDGTRTSVGGVTANHQPTLVGTYDPGGVVDPGTMIQVIDRAGNVLGTAPLLTKGKNPVVGSYAVTFDRPLTDGTHVVHVRAEVRDHVSDPSPAFVLKVFTRHHGSQAAQLLTPPGGPLGVESSHR
jgi:hypothetical protein